jgi:1-acyl-sn-glycerol-3-phosphate acyltransferase
MASTAPERTKPARVAGTDFRAPRLHLPTLRLWNTLLPLILRRFSGVVSVTIPEADLARLKALGGERLLLTPNHPTNTDPALLFALARAAGMPFSYLACRETFDGLGGLWGQIIQRLGAYSVVRGTADRDSFRMTRELLTRPGGKVVIFPEGEVYSENDSLLPFQTGVAQLGFWALEDLRKSGETGASVSLLPVAVRYRFVQDMTVPIRRSLSRLEEALRLSSRDGVGDDDYVRLRRIGVTMLGIMEAEYGLKPADGGTEDLSPRMAAVKTMLLGRAAALMGVDLPAEATLPERMRMLMNSVYAVTREEPGEARSPYRERLHRQQTDRVAPLMLDLNRVANWIAVQDNYVRASPTPERMADNLRRLETEAFGSARLRGLSRATVRVGSAINLADFADAYKADKRGTVARVTHALEAAVQALLDAEP